MIKEILLIKNPGNAFREFFYYQALLAVPFSRRMM